MKEESQYDLPVGWVWTKLGEIGIVVSGGTPSTKIAQFWGGDIPWITPADLSNYKKKFISKGVRNISQKGLEGSSAKLLPKGSILFSSRAPIGYVVISENNVTTNQGFKNLVPTKSIYSDYIFYYLKSVKSLAEQMASGTTFLELSASKFEQIPIPFPPIEEQKRIVSKLEEIFSSLDNAENSLLKSQKKIEVYRQALLKSTFEGKLTEKWRNGIHEISVTPRDIINDNIRLRKEYWEKTKLKEFAKRGKKLTNDDWKKLYRNPIKPEELGFAIPNQWELASWDQISNWITYGFTKPMPHSKSGVPIVTAKNIVNGVVDFNDIHFTTDEAYKSLSDKDKPEPEDVLITKDGTLGRAAVVKDEKFCVNQSVAVLWLRTTKINRQYLLYYIESPQVQVWIQNKAQGSTIKHLSISDFPKLGVPIPTYEEQEQIVQELESKFSLIDKLKSEVLSGLKKIEIFRYSILKKAFEGKLTIQDENDESAEKLIERIKNEKVDYFNKLKKDSKTQIRKKTTSKSLLEIINSYFANKEFSIDDLKSHAAITDEDLKNELFKILDSGKHLEAVFDEKSKKRLYKLKA